jgi:hypothetical protein
MNFFKCKDNQFVKFDVGLLRSNVPWFLRTSVVGGLTVFYVILETMLSQEQRSVNQQNVISEKNVYMG